MSGKGKERKAEGTGLHGVQAASGAHSPATPGKTATDGSMPVRPQRRLTFPPRPPTAHRMPESPHTGQEQRRPTAGVVSNSAAEGHSAVPPRPDGRAAPSVQPPRFVAGNKPLLASGGSATAGRKSREKKLARTPGSPCNAFTPSMPSKCLGTARSTLPARQANCHVTAGLKVPNMSLEGQSLTG